MSLYSRHIRKLLFMADAETAHDGAMRLAALTGRWAPLRGLAGLALGYEHPALQTRAAGLSFANPVGLAAGFDKTGEGVRGLAALGFGSIEIGSISALPSSGNPKPRLWRLPADEAVMVWYGIPNPGAKQVADALSGVRLPVPLGININTTNHGPQAPLLGRDDILSDYLHSARLLVPHADYLVLTLSCPNTVEGDLFAAPGNLGLLLKLMAQAGIERPIFIKPAPLESAAAMDHMLQEVEASPLTAGFIFNLGPQKPDNLASPPHFWRGLPGAISGRPVFKKNLAMVRRLYGMMDRRRYVIMGSGGIFSARDAYAYIKQGASLVQLLTALVFEGPGVVKRINQGLVRLLKRDGFTNISQAVGIENQ